MKKLFKDLTIDEIINICKSKRLCENCCISNQCQTLFKDTPEKWAYYKKEDMNKETL